jgi:hypothetical protein
MKKSPGDLSVLSALMHHIESAIDEINNAALAAGDLEYSEAEVWLEWIAEELGNLLFNVMQTPPIDESWRAARRSG